MTQEDYVKLLGAQHTPVDEAALLKWLNMSADAPLSAADPVKVKMWTKPMSTLNDHYSRAIRHLEWLNSHSGEIAAATTDETVLDKVHWYSHEAEAALGIGDYKTACNMAVAGYRYCMGQRQVSDATVPSQDGRPL